MSLLVSGPEESPCAQDAVETTSTFVFRTCCVFVVALTLTLYVLQAEGNGSKVFKLCRLITNETVFVIS